jgi:toxin FitB
MYVLDTNVISELRHGKATRSENVRAWAAGQAASGLFLTSITILELELGIQALEQRTPPQGGALRLWLAGLSTAFQGRILPFSATTAPICAALHKPNTRAERDAMIGATAKQHGFSIVTRNTHDFAGMGVAIINPWEI